MASKPGSIGDIRIAVGHGSGSVRRVEDQPFVVGVIGDFTGTDVGASPMATVDRDNFDARLTQLQPRWRGQLRAVPDASDELTPVELSFATFDDFHPDRIIERVAPLRALLETRRALEDPARFQDAAASVARWATSADVPRPQTAPRSIAVSTEGLLDRILDESEPAASGQPRPIQRSDLERFLERVVAPHLVRVDTQRQAQLIEAIDAALSAQLRSVLHDPAFQRLESAWRSLWELVRAVDDEVACKIRMAHCTRMQLAGDLPRLSEGYCGEDSELPPTIMIGNYAFTHKADDLALLSALAGRVASTGTPFIAAADPGLFGLESAMRFPADDEIAAIFERPEYRDWHAWRQSASSRWVSLALPRLLGRLPYGAATDPIDSFPFEEDPAPHHPGRLSWTNPAFGVATAAVKAFANEGWGLDLSARVQRLEDQPLYVYERDGNSVSQPCTETLLSDSQVDALGESGLLPLVAVRNRDVVLLPCVQSVHVPRMAMLVGRYRVS